MDLSKLTPAESWRPENWDALTFAWLTTTDEGRTALEFIGLARRARDVMTRRIPEGWTCRKSAKGYSVGGYRVPTAIADAMNLDDFYQPDPFSAWVYSDRWYAEHVEAAPKS
jgi:hypothetical protein